MYVPAPSDPNSVPMDGEESFFPKMDRQENLDLESRVCSLVLCHS